MLTLNHVQDHSKLPTSVQIFSSEKKSSFGKICTKGQHVNSPTERSSVKLNITRALRLFMLNGWGLCSITHEGNTN